MMKRLFLIFSAVVLAIGALMHASAFNKVSLAVTKSDIASFAGNSLKVLWLADSVTAMLLAAVFAIAAARPSTASNWILMLLAMIPATTAVLIYTFVGNFIGGHIMLAAGIAAFIGGLLRS
ncbi:MAG: hypothetical protein DMF25_10815 [Verrucomicrobia bacterium]|nr:MAG: hypothetical protein DMF25_10815 [Verrucomicrobiota bacterium]